MRTKINSLWSAAHKAIHTKGEQFFVTPVGNIRYPVKVHQNGCRFVTLPDMEHEYVTIMEQNQRKSSAYAERARNGETLSWVIPKSGGSWTLIEERVEQPKKEVMV